MLHRLHEYAKRGELLVRIEVPDDFAALFPEDWDGSDGDGGSEGWKRRADDRVSRLAESLRQHAADDIAVRITDADAEATAAGISYPRCTPRLAQILAGNSEEADALLTALLDRGAAADLLLPFLDRAAELQRSGWEAMLERLLVDGGVSWAAIRVALTRPCDDRLKQLAIEQTAPWCRLIDDLVLRGQIDHATLALLFEAPDPSVRRQAAVTIGTVRSGERLEHLPPPMLARWREIIVDSPANDAYYFPQLLKRDDQLCADWLRAWFGRHAQGDYAFRLPEVQAVIANLPVDVRIALIGDVPADVAPNLLWDAVRSLVSDDLDVMVALFDRPKLDQLHGVALRGGPSESWMVRALLALDRGWDPERIVAETQFAESGWSGEESQHWQRKVDAFARLRQEAAVPQDARRARIITAGIAYFERLRAAAAQREHRERIFGN